jgi:ABC-type transport system involved in Fe-S cluster assembly fused permease/ATPase subunit
MTKKQRAEYAKASQIDKMLAWDTDKFVTAEELWSESYPDSPLSHANTGFESRYRKLAEAINSIKAMFPKL